MVTAKQAYEWVKTGHWSLREFTAWFNEQVTVAKSNGQEEVVAMEARVWCLTSL